MSKSKCSSEERLQAVNDYLTGQRSAAQICNDMKIVSRQTLYDWVGKFGGHGENWFIEKRGNQRYSAARKEHAVEEYLKGRALYEAFA